MDATHSRSGWFLRSRSLFLGVSLLGSAAIVGCAAELDDPERFVPPAGNGGSGGLIGSSNGGGAGSSGSPGQGGAPSVGGTAGMGSGGMAPTGSGGAPQQNVMMPDCAKTILATQCANSCHAVSTPIFGSLNLAGSEDQVVQRLLDVPATNDSVLNKESCVPGALLINSANPAESVFLKRVKGTQDCGTQMPTGGLKATEIQCLESWIMSF